jgi:hypothetical protein
VLGRRIPDPLPPDPSRPFDTGGAVLSAAGLILLVMGILAADDNGWLALGLVVLGALVLTWFLLATRTKERAGKEPLVSLSLFRNRTSNLGMVTQNSQWLLLSGVSFVVSAYLQVVRGFDAIETGVIFSATTLGLMGASLAAERLARRAPQRSLILAGFVVTLVGVVLLLVMVPGTSSPWPFAPGLLLIGVGLGTMLTPSVNVVQSSFPDQQQGEISGVSRSVSNLGSSLGTAEPHARPHAQSRQPRRRLSAEAREPPGGAAPGKSGVGKETDISPETPERRVHSCSHDQCRGTASGGQKHHVEGPDVGDRAGVRGGGTGRGRAGRCVRAEAGAGTEAGSGRQGAQGGRRQ